MNFPFDTIKATQAACQFIHREGGRQNLMKLVKLLYLLDRLSIQRRGVPIVGGNYYSMHNGPVLSEALDLINDGSLSGEGNSVWEQFITGREHHEVGLAKADFPADELAEAELGLIQEIWSEHGNKDQWQLRDWCHENCPEWVPTPAGQRSAIPLAKLGHAVGLAEDSVNEIESNAREDHFMAKVLTPALGR